jgi:hypothetical protein
VRGGAGRGEGEGGEEERERGERRENVYLCHHYFFSWLFIPVIRNEVIKSIYSREIFEKCSSVCNVVP